MLICTCSIVLADSDMHMHKNTQTHTREREGGRFDDVVRIVLTVRGGWCCWVKVGVDDDDPVPK